MFRPSTSSSSLGISFLGVLALLLIGLKLGGVINWSWLWVLSPLWIPIALVLLAIVAVQAVMVIAFTVALVLEKFRK